MHAGAATGSELVRDVLRDIIKYALRSMAALTDAVTVAGALLQALEPKQTSSSAAAQPLNSLTVLCCNAPRLLTNAHDTAMETLSIPKDRCLMHQMRC